MFNCYLSPLISTASMIAILYGLSHILGVLEMQIIPQLTILIVAGILSFVMVTHTLYKSDFNNIRSIIRDTLIG